MVRKALKVNSALELNGAAVCVQQGTTTELNLADYFRANKMKLKTVTFASADETDQGLRRRPLRCVHHRRLGPLCRAPAARQARRPHRAAGDHLEGAARPVRAPRRRPVVRHREVDPLRDADAEELGVTKANVDEMMKSDQPGHQAPARHRGQLRRAARPDQRLGLPHHQACRQLRRDLREERRPGLAAEDRARPERAVDQGRPAIRPADPLSAAAIPANRAGWHATRPFFLAEGLHAADEVGWNERWGRG